MLIVSYDVDIVLYIQLLDIRKQHQQKITPAQVQPLPSQPISSSVIPPQAPTTTPELSLTSTVTVQTKPSVPFEMSYVNEHDPLLLDNKDTSPTIPCDTVFEESNLLMMKSSSHNKVSNNM